MTVSFLCNLNVLMIDKKHCLNMNCDCAIPCARVLSFSFFAKGQCEKANVCFYALRVLGL